MHGAARVMPRKLLYGSEKPSHPASIERLYSAFWGAALLFYGAESDK